jgi:CP family cyanate transporter-like MFS transporter
VTRVHPAWPILLAGVSAALHVGKLPPALPVLREALQVSLVEAGFLLSLVQLAGMTLALAVGAAADRIGARRTMLVGLAILSTAGLLGAAVTAPPALLALRAVEGFGFLLAVLPAPGLLRRVVEADRLSRMLGLWGAYMPAGTALALLVGPAVLHTVGWRWWWIALALVSSGMAVWLWAALPASVDAAATRAAPAGGLRATLRASGPWLAALCFGAYSAQWLSVVGFLPSIYAQAGIAPAAAAVATAFAAAVNMVGNVAAGRLLQRGVAPLTLLGAGFLAMGFGALAAFAPWTGEAGTAVAAARYAGVLLFSTVGGLVPGTLFSVAVRVAPGDGAVSTTVGWVQQWSAFGQFAGPPLVAAAAAASGRWDAVGWICAALALGGIVLAAAIGRLLRRLPAS